MQSTELSDTVTSRQSGGACGRLPVCASLTCNPSCFLHVPFLHLLMAKVRDYSARPLEAMIEGGHPSIMAPSIMALSIMAPSTMALSRWLPLSENYSTQPLLLPVLPQGTLQLSGPLPQPSEGQDQLRCQTAESRVYPSQHPLPQLTVHSHPPRWAPVSFPVFIPSA